MNSFVKLEIAHDREREQMLEMLLSALDGMVYRCRIDPYWTMEFVSEGCHRLTGYRAEDLLDNTLVSFEHITHPQDRQRVRDEIERAVATNTPFSIEYRLIDAKGMTKWVWERGNALPSAAGRPTMLHGFIQDITQRYLQERALRQAEQRYRSIFENANEGIFQTALDGHYLAVNPALVSIYGYDDADDLMRALVDIGKQLYVDPSRRDEFVRLMAANRTVINFESRVYRKDGSIIWISENAHVVHDGDGRILYYEGTVEDITSRKDYEERIAYQATHDVLTGLPNRALLAERIETAILDSSRDGSCFAVVFIDLDNFKTINDTMGHAAGDLLIKKVAERLHRALRDSDTVARIGGDEFVLLLTNVQRDQESLLQVMERVIGVIRKPFQLGEREYTVGCSIGISLHPADGMDAETLLRHADIAMYQAKDAGRNNYQFFTEEFNKIVMENHEIEQQLRQVLITGNLQLYYQPIVSAVSGQPVKAEALLRWQMADGRSISPARFIPIAEKTGLIEPLGTWVLEHVCKQIKRWQQAGIPPLPVSINISPRQFNQPDLLDNIRSALQRHALPPSLIEIEITENCLVRDKKRYLQTLADMKAMGLQVAIDDFGSGYSNMDCLKTMHFASLKIDRSFALGLESDANHRAIYRALISMAHNLNLVIVAEGVETQAQADFLRGIGCDLIQGFLYSKPLPAPQFEAFCEASAAALAATAPTRAEALVLFSSARSDGCGAGQTAQPPGDSA